MQDNNAASTPSDRSSEEPEIKYPRGRWFLLGAIVFVLLGAASLVWLPEIFLTIWFPEPTQSDRAKHMGTAVQAVLFSLGGIIAVVGVALSLSRHGTELQAAQREQRLAGIQAASHSLELQKEEGKRSTEDRREVLEVKRELRDRFVRSTALFADASPSSRKAGFFAFAALADDWANQESEESQVQSVIDVICSYLRSPMPSEAREREEEIEVRNVGFSLLKSRINEQDTLGSTRWSGYRFDLSNAVFEFPIDLSKITLSSSTIIDFSGSTFASTELQLQFMFLKDTSKLILSQVTLINTNVLAYWIRASGRSEIDMMFMQLDEDSAVDAEITRLSEGSSIDARYIKLEGGRLDLNRSEITGSAQVRLQDAELSGSAVLNLQSTVMENAGLIHIDDVSISGGSQIQLTQGTIQQGADFTNLPENLLAAVKESRSGEISVSDLKVSSDAV